MPERDRTIEAFLDRTEWRGARRAPLAGDASFRRYERLHKDGRVAVLMDAPPPDEDVRPFTRIARHLAGLGFSAPQILAEDADAGLLILEDLGDDTYTNVLTIGDVPEIDLYSRAVDVLIDLHSRPLDEAVPAGLPAYDEDRLLSETALFTDWYLPAIRGTATEAGERQSYLEAWRATLTPVANDTSALILRDYHVDNLIWLPSRPGVKACGLLDFQDAVAGAPAYDLMSLLEDARRDVDAGLRAAMIDRYHAALPRFTNDADWQAFLAVFAVLAVQRHAKVIGIFTRLCVRDAKPDYLVHIPRVWGLLESHLTHPSLAALRDWFDAHVPKSERGMPSIPGIGAASE